VTISGFASDPAELSFMLAPSAYKQSCLPVPADAGYPPEFPRTPVVERIDHAFSVNATVTGGSKALKSAYCAFLQTGGTFLGVPDGRVAARATKAFSVG